MTRILVFGKSRPDRQEVFFFFFFFFLFQIDFSSMILASSSVKMEKLDIAYTLNGRLVEPALSTYSSGLICAEIMNYLFTP